MTGQPPQVFTLRDDHGLELRVMDIGATWLSCRVPLADGSQREVLLGHAAPLDYLVEPGYLGAIVGRYANRIANARFTVDGRSTQLLANEGRHQLHGGPDGFHRRRFDVVDASPCELRLRLLSPDGDQGFPGTAAVDLRYTIEEPGRVRLEWSVTCTAACPINLSCHAYFNLDARPGDVRGHRLRIAGARMVPVDAELIPTGELLNVRDTAFDFSTSRRIGDAVDYDHCWLLDGQAPAALLESSDRALTLTLATDLPGLQFYAGRHLARTRNRLGQPYAAHSGLALEPQYLPDSPNRPAWPQPDCTVRPGQRLSHCIVYQFTGPSL
jgi:aldose 1-epimerase